MDVDDAREDEDEIYEKWANEPRNRRKAATLLALLTQHCATFQSKLAGIPSWAKENDTNSAAFLHCGHGDRGAENPDPHDYGRSVRHENRRGILMQHLGYTLGGDTEAKDNFDQNIMR